MQKLDEDNLNNMIYHWRNKNAIAKRVKDAETILVSSCYIDAYQTVRVNNGLPLLPK